MRPKVILISMVALLVAWPAVGAEADSTEVAGTTVNAFRLKNVKWPRGGYRIEFQFCLGELNSTQSFYYLSRHHDKIRAAAAGAGGK